MLSNIREIQSRLSIEIEDLRNRVEKCEAQGNENFSIIQRHSEEIKHLEERVSATEQAAFKIKDEKIPYIFNAPPQNQYFAGRTDQINKLKSILKIEEDLKEEKIRVAAVCGLGGIGKTSLVAEYAHQMKDFYKGGVYWFSAEDDTFLEKTVDNVALKLDTLLGSFHLTLTNMLKKVNTSKDPCLIVLDCLDQLTLSSNMMKFLSFPSQEYFCGHFLIVTRRNPNRLVNEISVLEENSCIQLKCFQPEEATQFLLERAGVKADENDKSDAESLCEELGRLPLALEQVGACINMLSCTFSSYLKQYKAEHLRLLEQQQARPVSPDNESLARLAVHTTWRINMEHMKKSPNGHVAVRFMNACSFFNGNEIEEDLINIGIPEIKDDEYHRCLSSPLGTRQIRKLLTDFSLFAYVSGNSVGTHRLVQEVVRESLTHQSKAGSFIDAVRMLACAFSKHPSPSGLLSASERNNEEQNLAMSDLPSFYMWSRLCIHGHHVCKHLEALLVTLDSACLENMCFPETAKILYHCSIYLSAHHKHEEAKRTLNFAYRILDWLPLEEFETTKTSIANNPIFPLTVPLMKSFQIAIRQHCMPSFVPHLPLVDNPVASGFDMRLGGEIKRLKEDGNKNYKDGCYTEALNAYSSAIDLAQDCSTVPDPLLFTNRSMVYIKLELYEDALKDAEAYITRRPDCWKGYARKALALKGMDENVGAEIAAALAFYYNRDLFSRFEPFKESFFGLQQRICVCDTVEKLRRAIFWPVDENIKKILILGSEVYDLNLAILACPWNNCILVGAKSNRSVSMNSNHHNPLLIMTCMLQNLSFRFEKGFVCCRPGSFVKMLNCNFTSYHDKFPVVQTVGNLNMEQCNITNSSSGLLVTERGSAVAINCSFNNNKLHGLEVLRGGTLFVRNSRIYQNRMCGISIGPDATKCVVLDSVVKENGEFGIGSMDSKDITLLRNNVFDNSMEGLCMMNSHAVIKGNNISDNTSWGIWTQSNSWCDISMNKVFRNKCGGVRVGKRVAGEEFRPSVVKKNKIFDNVGPGLLEGVNIFQTVGDQRENFERMQSCSKSQASLQLASCHDNEEYNNEGSKNVAKLNFHVPFCSSCRAKSELIKCKKCLTAAYCNGTCQANHSARHVKTCDFLRNRSSFLITSMETVDCDGMVTNQFEGLEKVGPNFSPPPPRDGKQFVVKVLSMWRIEDNEPYTFHLYDRSLELYKRFKSEVISRLVQEFGIQSELQFVQKKLFMYCSFEEDGQLRLFTNDFADFQKWY